MRDNSSQIIKKNFKKYLKKKNTFPSHASLLKLLDFILQTGCACLILLTISLSKIKEQMLICSRELHFERNIIWNRHGYECSRIRKLSGNFTLIQCINKCRYFFRAKIYRGRLFIRAESSLIQSNCRSLRNLKS